MLRQLIIITGPTGVGKTTLGIKVAKAVGGEIISADSRQLYRFMDLGTAKPCTSERAAVKHHGLDLRDPDERYSAGQFVRYARALCEELWRQQKVPVVVGGTGLYIQAFLDGLWAEGHPAAEVRVHLQERLEKEGLGPLYDELAAVDPVAHAHLAPGDTQRVLRALEVAVSTGGKGGRAVPFDCLPLAFCLYRERAELNRRLDLRVEAMMKKGFAGEVEELVHRGYHRQTPGLQSVGYQELLDLREGKCSAAEAVARIKLRTRQYAKRQLTWFRKDRRYRWLDLDVWGVDGGSDRMVEQFRNQCGV